VGVNILDAGGRNCLMPESKRLDNVKSILTEGVSRVAKGKRIAEVIRDKESYPLGRNL
jgi:hypothetical protein